MKKEYRFILLICVVLSEILVLAFNIPLDSEDLYLKNYFVDSMCLVICTILFGFNLVQRRSDMFSPLTVFSVLYITMFFVTPIYDIFCKEYLWFGVDLFKYGVKGSAYALMGYIAFILFYSVKFRLRGKRDILFVSNNCNHKIEPSGRKFYYFIVCGYVVCLLANIYYMISSSGNSIMYILTLGLAGSGGATEAISNIGFISMLSYALPSFTILYIEYGNKRLLKIIFFVLMFILQVARGFRFFIIQIILMFGVYYFLSRNKKPKLKEIVYLGIAVLIPVLLMTMFRSSLRSGGGMDLSALSGETIRDALDDAFWDNLRIYKTYYAIVKAVPDLTGYLYGKQMIIYTLIMFIPRRIWPGKPGNPGTKAQELGINKVAVLSGSAYPGVAEYFYDCGLFGIIFWMGVFGKWMGRVQDKYRYGYRSKIDLMIYCTLLGTILQLVIRGYTPSNFWMVIFCMIPFWIIKKLFMVQGAD